MNTVLQYVFATRDALLDGTPVIVAQTIVCATVPFNERCANYDRYVGDPNDEE